MRCVVTLWSMGYEGHTPDSFLRLLRSNGINAVADVRELPLSRKKGFSKRSLERSLMDAGIGYVHLRALGAPRDVRHEYHATGDRHAFHAAYAHHLDGEDAALDQLVSLAQRRRTAMLCVEVDMDVCHRIVIARRLEEAGHTVVPILPTQTEPPGPRP